MSSDRKPDPYVAFKSDRDRLWALISRDISKVAIAALSVLGLLLAPQAAALLRWLRVVAQSG